VASFNYHKVLLYGLVSTIAVSATISNALRYHSNFYSAAIYLSKSNRSVLILANFGLLIALLCGQLVQQIFFGALRPQEVERLYDRLWFFVTESLLAFTIFRDDFDIPFALMFGFLLFVRSFHWLASDRIEWMDQRPYPGPPTLFHIRMTTLFVILWCTDLLMFAVAVDSTLKNGIGGMVMFASEYAILMASAMNTTAKYCVCVIDLKRARQRGGESAPPWQNKSMWVFYIELVTDFLKLTTYLLFFLLIVAFYGLPLNIIRDVYLTGRSFVTRLRALVRYRAATRNMDERYPDASEEEMSTMTDRTCIICREEMFARGVSGNQGEDSGSNPAQQNSDGPNTTPKKLPCGHVFHFYCLRSWLERQQSCPTCRRSVLENAQEQQRPAGAQVGVIPGQPINFGNPMAPGNQPQAPRNINDQPPPNAVAQGWLPGQAPGVVIQYNIQYQGPPPSRDTSQAPVPATPQPVPRFAGFTGLDGQWRQWGMDPRWFGDEPSGVSEQPSAITGDSRPNPRDAAAAAASQRFGHKNTQRSNDKAPVSTNNTPAIRPASSEAPTVSTSDAGVSSAMPDPDLAIPSFIPLHAHEIPSRVGTLQGVHLWQSLPPSSNGDEVSTPYPSASVPVDNVQTSLRGLPPNLTDEQLMLMDRITREAIDERLRILEGVSVAVSRCMEDLTRVRSALPVSSNTPIVAQSYDTPPSAIEESNT
jgi:E3 ubiquitin-protein ligase synoviolin